jgi:formylmethanofuran dehydrogenase subunit A
VIPNTDDKAQPFHKEPNSHDPQHGWQIAMEISLLFSDKEEVTLVNTDCPPNRDNQGFPKIVFYVYRRRSPSVLCI